MQIVSQFGYFPSVVVFLWPFSGYCEFILNDTRKIECIFILTFLIALFRFADGWLSGPKWPKTRHAKAVGKCSRNVTNRAIMWCVFRYHPRNWTELRRDSPESSAESPDIGEGFPSELPRAGGLSMSDTSN